MIAETPESRTIGDLEDECRIDHDSCPVLYSRMAFENAVQDGSH